MKLLRSAGWLAGLIGLMSSQVQAQTNLQVPQTPPETQLDEIVVTGGRLRAQAEAFVESVAAPPEGRKLATWRGSICVAAAGLAPEASQVMVDRILDWGHSLGLRVGAPGCRPNILIVFGEDGDQTARELVRTRPSDFDTGIAGMNGGRRALRAFQTSGRPVRWWHASLPLDPDTGDPLVRLRGEAPFSVRGEITRPSDLGSFGQIVMGSRLYDDSMDALQSLVVVVDAQALEQSSFGQLSDYVAMIALAQIEPDPRPAAASILNLFNDEGSHEPTLTSWDQAFLEALYKTQSRNVAPNWDGDLIAQGMARRLQQSTRADLDP